MVTVSPTLAHIAYLAEGIWPTDAAAHVPVDAVELLRHHKVSLLPARRTARAEVAALLATEPFASYIAHEERLYAGVRREYARVRAGFAQASIRDVLIKSAGIAPSFPHLSDNVDDLVPAEQVAAARSVLLSLGYVELRNLEEPHKFFFKRFAAGQEVAAHHLHAHVGWAVSFLDEELLFERARPALDDPELLIPYPEDAFLITIAHAFYENKAIKLGDLLKVRQCLRSGELDWRHLYDLATDKGWRDGLNILVCLFSRMDTAIYGFTLFPEAVVADAWRAISPSQRRYVEDLFSRPLERPLPVSFTFSKRLFYAKCVRDRRRSAAGKVYDIVRHTLNGAKLKLKVHSQPGMLITFSGMDGSGKTAHARALVNAFGRCGIRVSYVWTRSGSSPFTDAVLRLGRAILCRPQPAAGRSQAERAAHRRQALRNPLWRAAWTALVAVDLLWQYTMRVRVPLLVGQVVVCDRYVYDAMADSATDVGDTPGLLLRLVAALCPHPTLLPGQKEGDKGERAAFLISVPPAVAAARGVDNLPLAELERQAALYASLAAQHRLSVVDNTGDFAAANDPLVHRVIRGYYRRYRTAINALFMANPHST